MHICLLTPSFLPVVDGGVPIASGRITTSLLQAGHRITALTVPSEAHLHDTMVAGESPNFTLHYRLPELPLKAPERVEELCQWAYRQHQLQPFDIILAYFIHPSGYLATVLGERLRLPVVCSCRGSDISTGVFFEPETVTRVLQRSTRLIFVSAFLLDMAEVLTACREKATVVSNAVDNERFAPAIPSDVRSGSVVVGTCGLLRWKKGLDLFLPLVNHLCKIPEVRVLIAGHGLYDADEQQIEDYLRAHHLQNQVEKTGPIPYHDVVHTLRRIDVYVNTSYLEGMPNAVLEAMACGLPVVATDAGDTSRVVEHGRTGFVCPRGDLDAIVGYTHQLIKQPGLRRQMGWAGRERIMEDFPIEREVTALEHVLREARASYRGE